MTVTTMKVPALNMSNQRVQKFPGKFRFPRSSHEEPASVWIRILSEFETRGSFQTTQVERFLGHFLSAILRPVLFCLTLLFILIANAHGQTNVWQGPPGAGDWFLGGNWSLDAPPNGEQDAVVDNGSTAQYEPLEGDGAAMSLTIGATTAGSTVQVLDGNLTLGSVIIGPQGTLRFSGGFVAAVPTFQNNGTMLFEGPFSQFVDVPIVGTGRLIVATDLLQLFSINTYSGATTVISGILQAGSATAFSPNSAFTVNSQLDLNGFSNTIGSLAGTGIVTNNGGASATLAVGNDNTSTIFGGTLQNGTGILGLSKVGTGVLTLTGANTYTGGTIINAGTLQIGNGGTTGSIVGNVIDNGVLAFNRSDSFVFGGAISGIGSLQQNGSGTLVLTGSNTYAGGTTIAGGTILTQNASALGTGPLAFGNGATLQVQDLLSVNGNWTVSSGSATVNGGVVQTFGDFNLGGGGTLIANANFNVPGAANINSSGFVVNSAFTVSDDINLNGSAAAVVNGLLTSPNVNVNSSSSLIVNNPGIVAANVNVGPSALLGLFGRINGSVVNAGFFQGTGVVNGNVFNSGIVSPGASIGTLTINGDYTQNASGTLRIEVAGASAGQYDVLAVNGRAFLAGTLQLVRVGNFRLQVGDRIAFLTATGGVNGTFSNIENDFLATDSIVVLDVVYLANSAVLAGTQVVVLEGTQGSFAEFASLFCGTPNAIAVGEALDSAVGDPRALELIDFLNNQALTDLCEDIDLISPEQLTSIFVVGVSLANVQTANLERRMTDIRAGSNGFSGGIAINGSAPSFWEGFAGVSGPEGKSGPAVFAPVPQNRWGVFATGLGEFTNVDSTFNASGFDLATGGFTMGVDYRIGSNFAVGLTGGYAYTSADLVNESSIGVNGGKLGVYATAFSSGFYLDTAVIGGLSGYDTRRTALEGTARGETLGGDLNVAVAGGYDWKKGGLTIGPTASFQYTLVGFDGFSESGSLAPLAFPSQHAESFRTAFGARASYDWKIGPAHIIPELRLAWQHEFGDTDYSLVSSFASGAGNSFTVSGPAIGRDSMLIGAGFAIHWNDRISTYAYYDGELFRTNYLSNNISAGFRLTF
jgi:fibronectin-binding autotransporter adhesin